MIPHTAITWQSQSWQQQLSSAVTKPEDLCRRLQLDPVAFADLLGSNSFPLRVPEYFVGLMEPGNLADPLLLQVLPQLVESLTVPGYDTDPVSEQTTVSVNGMIQKYAGRVLLMVTGACAIHCRYCFRRHFPYQQHRPDRSQWNDVLATIAGDPSIKEVILSGGDPLVANDTALEELVTAIALIEQVKTLRIHTRLPVVLPDRIDGRCLKWLRQDKLQVVVVIHCNHPREVSPGLAAAVAAMRETGALLLNQSVLLRGINNQASVLAQLSEELFRIQVLPYYLHLLDRVHGAAHFDVGESEARQLHQSLQGQLPGYLVPKLVREIAGAPSKVGLA